MPIIQLSAADASQIRYGWRRADASAHTPGPAWRALKRVVEALDAADADERAIDDYLAARAAHPAVTALAAAPSFLPCAPT